MATVIPDSQDPIGDMVSTPKNNHEDEEMQDEDLLDEHGVPEEPAKAARYAEVGRAGRAHIVKDQPRDAESPHRIVLSFSTKLLDDLRPASFLHHTFFGGIPAELQPAAANYTISWTLNSPLKPLVLNAREHIEQPIDLGVLSYTLPHKLCPCHKYPDSFKLDFDGLAKHVCTRDLGIIGHPDLESLLSKGLNHIPEVEDNLQLAIEQLESAAEQYAQRLLDIGLQVQDPEGFIANARARAQPWAMACIADKGITYGDRDNEIKSSMRSRLSSLKKEFWLTEVDKAPNNLTVVCPALAQHIILTRLEGADFEPCDHTPSDVWALLRNQLATISPELKDYVQEGSLPIMRITFKSHKEPVAWRYITNASGTGLSGLNSLTHAIATELDRYVADYLDTVMRNIQAVYGIPACANVVINNAQHMVLNLPDKIHRAYTADITRCFENIPIDPATESGLPHMVDWFVDTAFDHFACSLPRNRSPYLSVPKPGTKGKVYLVRETRDSADRIYLTREQAKGLINLAVQSAYVTAGGRIYRQTKGIPMGADYSPLLCNRYLTYWEHKAMRRQLALITDLHTLRKVLKEWEYFFRLMDDVSLLNAPNLSAWIKSPCGTGDNSKHTWVYPDCLLVDTTADINASALCGGSATFHYLDLSFKVKSDATYTHTIYLPEVKLPFKPIKYISPYSNRPSTLVYNTPLSQLYRALYLNSEPSLLRKSLQRMVTDLKERGYSYTRVKQTFIKWVNATLPLPASPINADTCLSTFYLVLHR